MGAVSPNSADSNYWVRVAPMHHERRIMRDGMGVVVGTIVVVAIIWGVFTLEFRAYKARFPNAPTWTFFFQGGSK